MTSNNKTQPPSFRRKPESRPDGVIPADAGTTDRPDYVSEYWSRDQLSEYYGIQAINITKQFDGVKALDDVSLTIPIFGMTSIVGPNGSGKSTLVNLLTGVLPYDEGVVMIETNAFKVIHAHETPDHGITRTFQEVRLFDQMTVWDNMMVVLTNRKLFPSMLERSKSEHRQKAERILKQVGMWEKRESMAGELSYGQRKLLEIGRAIALEVQVYILDEPFAGLFPQMLEQVKDILRDMRASGRTVVFISHNMDIVRELSDHIIVLEGGNFLLSGEVEDILNRPEVIRAYLGA